MAPDETKDSPEADGALPQAELEGGRETRPPHSWVGIGLGFVVVLVALGVGITLVVEFLNARTRNLVAATEGLSRDLEETLERDHIPKQAIKTYPAELRKDAKARWNFYLIDVEAPAALNLEGVEKLLRRDMEAKHVVVNGSLTDHASEGLSLQLENREFALIRATQKAVVAATEHYAPPAVVPAPSAETPETPSGEPTAATPETPSGEPAVAAPEMNPEELPLDSINLDESEQPHVQAGSPGGDVTKPRAAIILDDGGYGGAATEVVLKLNPKVTLAILPNTPHATETAERAKQLGFEVMLHMPMEAMSAKDNFPGYISANMRTEQMRGMMDAALSQIPGAVGINNHTGSKFTANTAAMKAFVKAIGDRPLYFIDSHTASGSVAYSVAAEMGIKAGVNNLFLDNKSDPELIRAQVVKFVALCKTQGHGIAIGHFRPHTAAVLTEEIPKLASEGITLVHVSELLK